MNLTAIIGGGLSLVAVVAAGFAWLQTTRLDAANATIKRQRDDLVEAVAVNAQNIKAFDDLKKEVGRVSGIEAKYDDLRRKSGAARSKKLQEIENAPAKDDGPLAPVLRDQLERMRAGEFGGDEAAGAPADLTAAGKADLP